MKKLDQHAAKISISASMLIMGMTIALWLARIQQTGILD